MSSYKLIFTGPSGAGKTTAISVLSDIAVVKTEAKASKRDPNHKNKQTITVGLDYGIINLKNKDKIYRVQSLYYDIKIEKLWTDMIFLD